MIEKIKLLLSKDKKKSNLVLIILLLIIVLIATNYIFNDETSKNTIAVNGTAITYDEQKDLETKLAQTISKIKGVEEAYVMISYSTTEKIIPVYDIKEDINSVKEDVKESTKTTTEKTVAYESRDGGKVAIVESRETAEATGAIVVVNGKIDENVKNDIKQAVGFVGNIPIHKIQIFVNE